MGENTIQIISADQAVLKHYQSLAALGGIVASEIESLTSRLPYRGLVLLVCTEKTLSNRQGLAHVLTDQLKNTSLVDLRIAIPAHSPAWVFEELLLRGLRHFQSSVQNQYSFPVWIRAELEIHSLLKMQENRKEASEALAAANVNSAILVAEIEEKNEIIDKAKKDIESILDNLDQGFMVIDRSGKVLQGCSSSAKKFFGADVEGKHLAAILKEDHERLSDWITMLFEEPISFKGIRDLGPLLFETDEGRTLKIDYRPIRDELGNTDGMIVISTDTTQERLFQEQADAEIKFEKMLVTILVDRPFFSDFVELTRTFLKSLKVQVRTLPTDSSSLEEVLRNVHSIKGGMAVFHIGHLKKLAHQLEEQISLKKWDECCASLETMSQEFEDFLKIHRDLIGQFDSDGQAPMVRTRGEVLNFGREMAKTIPATDEIFSRYGELFFEEPVNSCFHRFIQVTEKLAQECGKQVKLSISPSSIRIHFEPYRSLIHSLLHLFSNAIDHGIESPDEREAMGKPSVGQIKLDFETFGEQKHLRFTISDDGRGIPIEEIKLRALEKGLFTVEELQKMSKHQLMQLIFKSGFSSRAEVSQLSGRGVGLDAVKNEVEKLGGSLEVGSEENGGSFFTIEVPRARADISRLLIQGG